MIHNFNEIDFWNRTKAVMKSKKISYVELSERIETSKHTIYSYIQRGVYPTLDIAVKIANVLDVSVEYLATGTERVEQTIPEKECQDFKNRLAEINQIVHS